MRSVVDIRVGARAGGTTVMHRLEASGQIAVRRTGPTSVHLVGAAAGPLGGDGIEIRVHVEAGAELSVSGVAASIVLPGRDDPASAMVIKAVVEDGARLRIAPEPVIVCAGAEHAASTLVDLQGSASAHVLEKVVLGRHGEPGGHWVGHLRVTRDGHPLLRQTMRSHWMVRDGARALVAAATFAGTVAGVEGDQEERDVFGFAPPFRLAATFGDAVAMPLAAGGLLVTATGPDVTTAMRHYVGVLDQGQVLRDGPDVQPLARLTLTDG